MRLGLWQRGSWGWKTLGGGEQLCPPRPPGLGHSEARAGLHERPPPAAAAQGPTSRPARQAALPFELVEDECAHREESDDQEDRHCPVATGASQPLRTCKPSSWWWAGRPRPGLLGQRVSGRFSGVAERPGQVWGEPRPLGPLDSHCVHVGPGAAFWKVDRMPLCTLPRACGEAATCPHGHQVSPERREVPRLLQTFLPKPGKVARVTGEDSPTVGAGGQGHRDPECLRK